MEEPESGEIGRCYIVQDLVIHDKGLGGFYFRFDGETVEGFKLWSTIIRLMFSKDYCSCYKENRLQGEMSGNRETNQKTITAVQVRDESDLDLGFQTQWK